MSIPVLNIDTVTVYRRVEGGKSYNLPWFIGKSFPCISCLSLHGLHEESTMS